jgi:hypothetical protein
MPAAPIIKTFMRFSLAGAHHHCSGEIVQSAKTKSAPLGADQVIHVGSGSVAPALAARIS